MSELEYHEIANIFPMMSVLELAELSKDISEQGLLLPIMLYEGKILDGRNRYEACSLACIEPTTEPFTGSDPLAFVVAMNMKRRHLNRDQRDELIRDLRSRGMTLKAIAYATGVSVGTAHAMTQDVELFNSEKLVGEDGKARPVHYAPRTVTELEPEDDDDESDDEEAPTCYGKCVHATVDSDDPDSFWCDYEERSLHIEQSDKALSCESYSSEDAPPEEPIEVSPVTTMPHVAHNSGNNEWYTPAEYADAARAVMGVISLDPASSEIANKVIKANSYFTIEDDGLQKQWTGTVFMNPPYAQPLVAQFCEKLSQSVICGDVTEAIVLVNNATETGWFHTVAELSSAICFPKGRLRFWSPDRDSASPLQGQAVVYIGQSPGRFCAEFAPFGLVVRHERL